MLGLIIKAKPKMDDGEAYEGDDMPMSGMYLDLAKEAFAFAQAGDLCGAAAKMEKFVKACVSEYMDMEK